MWHSAVNSLIAEYLQTSNLQFTLSVFNSEADVTEQPAFSVDDLCQLMRLDRQPQLLERVQQLMQTEGKQNLEVPCTCWAILLRDLPTVCCFEA